MTSPRSDQYDIHHSHAPEDRPPKNEPVSSEEREAWVPPTGPNKKMVGALVGGMVGVGLLLMALFLLNRRDTNLVENSSISSLSQSQGGSEQLPTEGQKNTTGPAVDILPGSSGSTSGAPDRLAEPSKTPQLPSRALDIHYPKETLAKTGTQKNPSTSTEAPAESGNDPGQSAPSSEGGMHEPPIPADPQKQQAKGESLLSMARRQGFASANVPIDRYEDKNLPFYLDFSDHPEEAAHLMVIRRHDGYDVVDRREAGMLGLSLSELQEKLRNLDYVPNLLHPQEADPREAKTMPKSLVCIRLANSSSLQSQVLPNDLDSETALLNQQGENGAPSKLILLRNKEGGQQFDVLRKEMGQEALSPAYLKGFLRNKDETSTPPTPPQPALTEEKEWAQLLQTLKENPSQVEWRYGLPLLSSLPGSDLRQPAASVVPSYESGLVDFDGDGYPEYVLHASMWGETQAAYQGYWAIFTPSSRGLLVSALHPYGNGDMIFTNNGLLFSSLSRGRDKISFHLASSDYPRSNKSDVLTVDFHQPQGLGQTLRAREIDSRFHGYYIVPHKGELFLVSVQDFDYLMDYAENCLKGGLVIKLSAGPEGDEPIQSVVEYLQRNFRDLPITEEDWRDAKPLASFLDQERPIRYEDFNRDLD